MVAEQRQAAVGLASIAQERPASFVLGFLAGFVDIAGYIALFGLFSANMTGNLVLAGVELMQPQGGMVASRVMALPLFMLGVALGWLIAAYAKPRGWPVGSVLAASEAIALALFLAIGKIYAPDLHAASQQTLVLLIGCFALIAMGLQNALSRELFANMPATTGMTSNLSLFVLDSAELITARLIAKSIIIEPAFRANRPCGGTFEWFNQSARRCRRLGLVISGGAGRRGGRVAVGSGLDGSCESRRAPGGAARCSAPVWRRPVRR